MENLLGLQIQLHRCRLSVGAAFCWKQLANMVQCNPPPRCVVTASAREFATTAEEPNKQGLSGERDGTEAVLVQFRGNEIRAPKGSVLRTALLQNGLTPHNGKAVAMNCRGAGLCGTCAVQIEGDVIPSNWGPKESRRLNMPPHGPPQNVKLRLACSVQLDGDVKVTKYDKLWGQGDIPMEPTSVNKSVTPLGRLEFLLDSKSKKGKSN